MLSIALTLAMLVSMLNLASFTAFAATSNGVYTPTVTIDEFGDWKTGDYTITNNHDGTITFSGLPAIDTSVCPTNNWRYIFSTGAFAGNSSGIGRGTPLDVGGTATGNPAFYPYPNQTILAGSAGGSATIDLRNAGADTFKLWGKYMGVVLVNYEECSFYSTGTTHYYQYAYGYNATNGGWQLPIKVTYDTNGGDTYSTALNPSHNYEYLTPTEALSATAPTKAGCPFLGWFTAPTGGTQVTTVQQLWDAADCNNSLSFETTIYAQWGAHTHCICGDADCKGTEEGHEIVTFEPLPATGYDITGGNYYLDRDITLSSDITFNGIVNLDLNGHVLKGTGNDSVICVGHTLNLCDCNSEKLSHKFTVGADGLWEYAGAWASGDEETEDVKKVEGGVITGGSAPYTGGGIFIPGMYFTMYGGTICGNTSADGGGVCVEDATFTMNGGMICGNTTNNELVGGGGGVCLAGTFVMNGGEISGNTAETGGGILACVGSLSVSGNAKITGNHNADGAVSNVYLRDDMEDIYITVAGELGDDAEIGVSSQSDPTAEAPVKVAVGGTGHTDISGDLTKFFADSDAYHIESREDGGYIALGAPVAAHTHCICGDVDCERTEEGHEIVTFEPLPEGGGFVSGGSYYLDRDITLYSILRFGEKTNLDLNGHVLKGTGENTVIQVDVDLNLCDCNSEKLSHKFTVGADGLWEYAGAWASGDEETETVKKVEGGVITGGKGDYYGGGICAFGDVSTMYGGTICGNTSTFLGGGVDVEYGTFIMNGGTICGNTAKQGAGVFDCGTLIMNGGEISGNTANRGGGVYIEYGALTMNGGEISGNTANCGGGVSAEEGSVFTMNGGLICGNMSTDDGGGVNLIGAFTMNGGEISGNTAVDGGGGVYAYNSSSFALSGNAKITGNKRIVNESELDSNVHLPPNVAITVSAPLGQDAGIGIDLSPGASLPKMIAQGGTSPAYSLTGDDAAAFSMDDDADGNVIRRDEANNALYIEAPPHVHDFVYSTSGNSIIATCVGEGDCAYNTTGVSLTLDVAGCNKNYDGSACAAATVTPSANWSVARPGSLPPVHYTKGGTTPYNSTTPPTDSGTYMAVLTVEDKTVELPFTIYKATQNATVVMNGGAYGVSLDNPTLSGEAESPSAVFYYNTTGATTGGAEWNYGIQPTFNVGDYYMYAKLSSTNNYNEFTTPAVKFTITAGTMSGVSAADVTAVYDGDEHGITVNAPDGATVTYGTTAGVYDLDESPSYKNVSATPYTVYYKVTKPNYADVTGSATVTITKKAVTVTPKAGQNKIYGYTDPIFEYDALQLVGDDTLSGALGRVAGENKGEYAYTLGTLSGDNYTVSLAADAPMFNIKARPVVISWSEETAMI